MKNRKSMGKAQWKRKANIRNTIARRTRANELLASQQALEGLIEHTSVEEVTPNV